MTEIRLEHKLRFDTKLKENKEKLEKEEEKI
jgi:hypothetical protein